MVGLRSHVFDDVDLKDSVILGADYYDPPGAETPSGIPLGIGPGSVIEGAIIDKNTRLGAGVVIHSFPRGTDIDSSDGSWYVRDEIVVITKDAVIPAHTTIGPDVQLSFLTRSDH